MPILALPFYQQEEIYILMKKIFSDIKCFDLIASSIKMLIHDASKMEIDPLFMISLDERYLSSQPQLSPLLHPSTSCSLTKEQKQLLLKLRTILTTTAIYLYSLHPFLKSQLYHSIDELLHHYPDFKQQIVQQYPKPEERYQELQYLLHFRNFMVIALMLIPAKGNKTFLLKTVERLEGSGREYIMGTGQKPAVTRRLEIFHQESRIPFAKRTGKRQREKQLELLYKTTGAYPDSNYSTTSNSKMMAMYTKAVEESKENYGCSSSIGGGGGASGSSGTSITHKMMDLLPPETLKRVRSKSPSSPTPLKRKSNSTSMSTHSNNSMGTMVDMNTNYLNYAVDLESISWEMSEETINLLLDEDYHESFTEEIHQYFMDE